MGLSGLRAQDFPVQDDASALLLDVWAKGKGPVDALSWACWFVFKGPAVQVAKPDLSYGLLAAVGFSLTRSSTELRCLRLGYCKVGCLPGQLRARQSSCSFSRLYLHYGRTEIPHRQGHTSLHEESIRIQHLAETCVSRRYSADCQYTFQDACLTLDAFEKG